MRTSLLFLLVTSTLLNLSIAAKAEIPQVISYQGKVTDSGGTPVPDGSYDMAFRIYDAATGGTAPWNSGTLSVDVTGGVFSVLLGDGNPINLDFDEDYWLEVEIESDVQSPRQSLGSVGYAYMSSGLVVGTNVVGSIPSGGVVDFVNTSGSGISSGIYAASSSTAGSQAVYGEHTATAGGGRGVFGKTSSVSGRGVFGWAAATTGQNYGIYGTTSSTSGYAGYFVGRGYFSGNVGIGTTNPGEKLVVKMGGATWSSPHFAIEASGSTNKWDFTVGSSDRFFIGYNESSKMVVATDGNVGIGTISPVSRVSIVGDTSQDVNIDITTKELNHNATLKLCEGEGCVAGMYWQYDGANNQMKLYGVDSGTHYGPHITVNRESGRVGIGTDIPSKTLTVNGTIEAEEIEVVAAIADYVFNDNYSRMSLEELEQYIQEHHHLPGIVSEKEVVQRGGTISVGKSYTQLLEKVEELTLYVIEQNKTIRELQNVIRLGQVGK